MLLKSAGTAVIAAALLAGTSMFALAQSSSQQPSSKEHGGSMNAPQHSQMQSPSRSTTGQSTSEKGAQSGQQSSQDEGRSKDTQAAPSKSGSKPFSSDSKSTTSGQNDKSGSSRSERNAQGSSTPSERNAQSGTSRDRGTASQNRTSRNTTASAPAGERVNLSSEQKTQIRSQVIEKGNAPRVSHVNFSVNVGVAVPTTVRLAPVPQVLLEIHPGWRSYEYFVYEEEVVIVNPHTHRIVEVIVLS